MEWIISSPLEIQKILPAFFAHLGDRRKIALYGEMGVGKTTFMKAVGLYLGSKDLITSPTFSIVNIYALESDRSFYHLDLYRLEDINEALDIGIEDLLYDDNYCFIEWPGLIEPLLPDDVAKINLSILSNSSRKILFL